MKNQLVFERCELKYILDPVQKKAVLKALDGRMKIDDYGRTTIRNIYFDTKDYRLIRNSVMRPEYKEKLRIRSYKRVNADEKVFVELKKKYEKIVYKRRIHISEFAAMDWLVGGGPRPEDSQIAREIDYFRNFFEEAELAPKAFISYEREAFLPIGDTEEENPGLRITFDSNILARDYDLSLRKSAYGERVIPPEKSVLEIKIPKNEAMPMWLARCLSENHIFRSTFSKYGTYYMNGVIAPNETIKGGLCYA